MKLIQWALAVVMILSASTLFAAIPNAVTEKVAVSGACQTCQAGIESAAFVRQVSEASWDKNTQTATISYNSKRTTLDEVLRKIALAGYDNKSYLAPDDAYAKLDKCCQYERVLKPAKKQEEPAHHHAVAATETAVAADPLKPVFDAYFAVKNALVASDGPGASAQAANLLKAIKAVKMGELGNEQHMAWMKVMKDLAFDAEHISETKDVGHQRDHFASLSDDMYALIKVSKLPQPVYYQHCPMFNQGKGANWLSQEETIKNPYYGTQMLSCGKTTETLR